MRLCEYCSAPLSLSLRADAHFCGRSCQRNAFRDRETAAKAAQTAPLTQTERVLRALGDGPVAATDFAAPRVRDGGSPIMRVAARIGELREQGHHITTRRLPNGVAEYVLVGDVEHGSRPTAGERTDASPTVQAPVPGALGVHTTSPVPLSSGTGPATSASPHADVALFNAGVYQTPAHHHYQEV